MKSGERTSEIATLLSVTERSVQTWTKDARKTEKDEQKAKAWNLWLDCADNYSEIARQVTDDANQADTVKRWISAFAQICANAEPPESRQHFDIWNFAKSNSDGTYFGQMPPQVVENLLWFYTEPGQITGLVGTIFTTS